MSRAPKSRPYRIVRLDQREADEIVRRFHRHHRPLRVGQYFAIGLMRKADGLVVGAAIVGRPLARAYCDRYTAEVRRLAVAPATPNGCSMLLAASWRTARSMGIDRLLTYTLKTETGTSLRAAGWRLVGETRDGAGWSRPSRPRLDRHPLQAKLRWEAHA